MNEQYPFEWARQPSKVAEECATCGVALGYSLVDTQESDSLASTDGLVQLVLALICKTCGEDSDGRDETSGSATTESAGAAHGIHPPYPKHAY